MMPKKRAREHAGVVVAAVGILALAAALIAGVAGFDAAEPIKLTVTRVCGSAAFVGVILYLGYRPCRPRELVSAKKAAVIILPALIVAVNNMPILPLLSGEARVTAGAADIVLFGVECIFIGVFEETAFRGILLLTVAERFGETRRGLFFSALATSAFFGAAHLFNILGGAGVGATLLQAGYSFLIGGMCSLVLLLTGSLASCCVLHAIYDFGGYLVPRLGEGIIWTKSEIALTAVIGVVVLLYYLYALQMLSPEAVRMLTGEVRDEKADPDRGAAK